MTATPQPNSPYAYGQPDPAYGGQLPYQPPQYYGPGVSRPPRKKRRIFLWVFLAIQAVFVIWLIAGLAIVHAGPSQSELATACYHHQWWPLFSSQADCVTHYGGALTTAGNIGKGIGAAIIVVLWVVVDLILGISYGVYKLATRRA